MNDLSLDLFIVFCQTTFTWSDAIKHASVWSFLPTTYDFMIFHVSFQLGRTSDPPRWFAWFQHPYLVTKYTPNRAKWKNTFSSYKLSNFAGNCSFLEYLECRGRSIRFQKSVVYESWKDSPNLTDYENTDFWACWAKMIVKFGLFFSFYILLTWCQWHL